MVKKKEKKKRRQLHVKNSLGGNQNINPSPENNDEHLSPAILEENPPQCCALSLRRLQQCS